MYIRHYMMSATAGSDEKLRESLERLAAEVRGVPGSVAVHVFRDVDRGNQFIVMEQWKSVEAYKAGAKSLPKVTLTDVMSHLDAPPAGRNLTSVWPEDV